MNYLRFSRILISFFLSLLVVASCQKNANEVKNLPLEASEDEQGFLETYMIDLKIVNKKDFKWDVEGMEYHINVGEKDNPNSQSVCYMAFTSEQAYDNYMVREMGNKYLVHKSIIAHLRDYAQSSGAVDYLEQKGEVPQSYLDYEQRYLAEHLPTDDLIAAKQRSLVGVLFKDSYCRRAFNFTLPLLGTPFFIFNNNEASSFEALLIGGYHRGFDKSFYRRRIYSLWVWGFSCYNLPASVNDRISSWWSIGG